MNMVRPMARLALLTSLLMGWFAGMAGTPAALAQAGTDTYESPVSGAVVEVTAPWTFEDGISTTGTDEDLIGVRGDTGSLVIGYLPATTDADAAHQRAIDVLLPGNAVVQEIDSGSYDDVSYSLEVTSIDGVEQGVFSVYEEAGSAGFVTSTTYSAPAASFGDGLEQAQQHVNVDGTPVFDGVEGAGLQELLDAHDGVADGPGDSAAPTEAVAEGAATTPTATEASPGADIGDRDARKLPPATETPEATNESETGRAGQVGTEPADLSDLEDRGLVEEGIYVSPQYDTEVLWDDTWALYTDGEEPIMSDPGSGTDSLTLTWNGESFVLLYIDLVAADKLAPADFVDYWLSDDFLRENADPDAEVLLDDSDRASGAVLIRDYLSNGDEVTMLREAISLDGGETIALVTMIGLPDTFADAYDDAGNSITIDGEPAVLTFTVRQIERVQ